MNRVLGWSMAALMALGLASGCGGGSGNKNQDAGTPLCTANQATCFNDSVAVACNATGNALIPIQCGVGEKCSSGACVANPNAPCTSADNTCMDSTHAIICSTMGAQSMTCPSGTTCAGPGLCQGSCVVGSSICLDNGTVATCTDGSTFKSTTCGTGMACVTTSTDPVNTAACLAAACTPDPNGCDFVCGDKTNTPGSNGAATLSSCVATPTGYQWVAITCPSPQTCSPSASACSSGPGTQAACASQCNPGDTRCTDSSGFQTCGTDGTWGTTIIACNADPTNAEFICVSSNSGQGICADIACTDGAAQLPAGSGACDPSGMFHLCGTNGQVSATGTACTSGVCVTTSSGAPGTYQAGACVSECTNGDQQCVNGGGGSYQTCANGVWGAATECAAGANCIGTTGTNGRPSIVCGECIPGTHQCSGSQIELCGGTPPTWGAAADCAMGACQTTPSGDDALCVAQCFPGKAVCGGNPVTVPGVGVGAFDSSGTCTNTGTLPASYTACTAGEYCRTGPQGNNNSVGVSLGCVVCVSTANEFGLPDTRCENAGDTATQTGAGGYVEQCVAGAWDIADHTQCTAPNANCIPASTNITVPSSLPGNYCHPLFGTAPATQTEVEAIFQETCGQIFGPSNFPESCAVPGGGSVPDCCSSFCYADPAPTPAYCD